MKSILTLIFCLFSFSGAQAADVYEPIELKAVSNPQYMYDREVSVGFDYYPVGAFNKHVSLFGSYMEYFNDYYSAFFVKFGKAFELESTLKTALIESYGAQQDTFLVMNYYAKAGASYIPFYTKNIIFNNYLIHSRTFFNLNAGIVDYTYKQIPTISFGFAQNYYLKNQHGLKFDFEYMMHLTEDRYLLNQFVVSLGYVFSWSSDAELED